MNKVLESNDGKRVKKILIVESNELIAMFLSDLLKEYGAVDIAYNGQDALKRVFQEKYNAIFSDVNMPVMDGIEFYKAAVEKDPALKKLFLFHTSTLSRDQFRFFIDNELPVLYKLVDVEGLGSDLMTILERSDCETKRALADLR